MKRKFRIVAEIGGRKGISLMSPLKFTSRQTARKAISQAKRSKKYPRNYTGFAIIKER